MSAAVQSTNCSSTVWQRPRLGGITSGGRSPRRTLMPAGYPVDVNPICWFPLWGLLSGRDAAKSQSFLVCHAVLLRGSLDDNNVVFLLRFDYLWQGDGPIDLVELLINAKHPPRRRSASWSNLGGEKPDDLLVADIFENFAVLWDATSGDAKWCEHGALSLGVLKTTAGRSRLIPFRYRRELMIESRNCIGRGVATPRQLVVGMSAAEKTRPRFRLSLKQRKVAAKSPSAVSKVTKHAALTTTYKFEREEQLNYFYDSRPRVFRVCFSAFLCSILYNCGEQPCSK